MSVMRIFGDSISGNCLKVKWVANLLNRPYEWVEIDIMQGQSRTPEFLAMNPWGQVPVVLLEDGRPLAQSNAIMLHLAEGTDLIPSDAYDRAKMFEWLFWEQYSHEPTVAVVRFKVKYQKMAVADVDPVLFGKARACLERMEDHLTDRTFFVGDSLSLADVALVAYTRMAPDGGFDLSPYPALLSWIGRVESALGL
jgi:glutathione S-transferase